LSEAEANKELNDILDHLMINSGDSVMLGIDMGKIPLPFYRASLSKEAFREREQKWCQFVFNTLLERLGENGTLLVPTYTYSCGKPGSIFDSNTTRSEIGPFTEYFRKQPRVIRSLHPLFSIAGIGKYSHEILKNTGSSAFAMGSPFSRFIDYDIKFLCLGVEIRNSITYVHHLEQYNGGWHRYNKRFDCEVFDKNIKINREWSAFVAFRGIDYTSDMSSLQIGLKAEQSLFETKWKGNFNHMALVKDVNKVGYDLLMKNSLAFVNRNMLFSFDDSESFNPQAEDTGRLVVTVIKDSNSETI